VEGNLLVVGLAVLAFGLLSGRLTGTPITLPMVFTAAGLVLGPSVLGLLEFDARSEVVSALAEATLVVVLFSDASRLDLRVVVREHKLALRLLGLGLPLAIVVGTLVGIVLLPGLPVAAVALLAVVLAPTDAALGQAFVSDDRLPGRIRQTLNVESGLNDGLAVPFLTVMLDIARSDAGSPWEYVGLLAALVGIGAGIGALTGYVGGRLLTASADRGWITESAQRLSTITLAAIAYAGSELLGGNGFVAVFIAGLVVGTTARSLLPETAAFSEAEGQLLTLLTFLLFGSVVVGGAAGDLDWRIVLYALASLVLVRPVAVALSLIGSRASLATVAFVGWAGPRGLASIVYAVLVVDTGGFEGAERVFTTAASTILLSIYLHGTTALWLSGRYAHRMRPGSGLHRMEREHVSHLPTRPRLYRIGRHAQGDESAKGS